MSILSLLIVKHIIIDFINIEKRSTQACLHSTDGVKTFDFKRYGTNKSLPHGTFFHTKTE